MTLNKITEFYTHIEIYPRRLSSSYTEWFCVYSNTIFKISLQRHTWKLRQNRMIQINLVGIPMIVCFTKFHLSKCSGSWVVSIKQNMNVNFRPSFISLVFVSNKIGIIRSCSYLQRICHNKKFHSITLTGEHLAFTSEVWTFAILD
jgi:hypothetical protein